VYLTYIRNIDDIYQYGRESSNTPFATVSSIKQLGFSQGSTQNGFTQVEWALLPNGDYDTNCLLVKGEAVNFRELTPQLQDALSSTDKELRENLLLKMRIKHSIVNTSTYFDDFTSNEPGYSFVTDDRNQTLVSESSALFKFICTEDEQRELFFTGSEGTLDKGCLRRYLEKAASFSKKLLFLIHVTGGQPPRGTELNQVLAVNTSTSFRSIYWKSGGIVVSVSYNKVRASNDVDAFVPRFLSREVSQLLLIYLVYVKPFVE
jgi:hypothetical protein